MPVPASRPMPVIGAILLALTAGGGYLAIRKPPEPVAPEVVLEPPAAPVVLKGGTQPGPSGAVSPDLSAVAASAASQEFAVNKTADATVTVAPAWNGVTVTVVCPTSTDDTSLRAACPEYFTSSWKTAAVRDGYTSGSQKLAKVDCAMAHLSQLDAVTQESLTCRDKLNAAIYGQDGSGGGLCAADIKTYCKGVQPTPGSNPTDICLQAVVTDGDAATALSAACATAVANHAYAEAAVKASGGVR